MSRSMPVWSSLPPPAPPGPSLQISEWVNSELLDLAQLRGKVVALHAFQMLCPTCISHGLPQAERLHRLFRQDGLVVIGLHTVFEHHAVMNADALRAFVHEYRWSFPIGIDRPQASESIPVTMQAYGLQGTPSLVLLDREGRVRLHHFGHIEDLVLGRVVGALLGEIQLGENRSADARGAGENKDPFGAVEENAVEEKGCGPQGCALPLR